MMVENTRTLFNIIFIKQILVSTAILSITEIQRTLKMLTINPEDVLLSIHLHMKYFTYIYDHCYQYLENSAINLSIGSWSTASGQAHGKS